MRLLLAFLAIATSLHATSYTLAVSGTIWGNSSAWSPPGIPGNNDTVNIPDGTNVMLNESRIIGTSGVNGTIAVQLNTTGKLIITAGGNLTARGDIVYAVTSPCNDTSMAVQMQAGATLTFDSSLAASPSTTRYTFGQNGDYGCRRFVSTGTSSQRNTITSVRTNAAGAGRFSQRGFAGYGGDFEATYTDISYIGDASNSGWELFVRSNIAWDVTYSTFDHCGVVYGASGIDTGSTFRHSYNLHTASTSGEVLSNWAIIVANSGGIREIRNNLFDVPMSNSAFYPIGFTLYSNYFGQATKFGPVGGYTFQGNLLRYTAAQETVGYTAVGADLLDSIIMVDADWGNPKPIGGVASSPANLRGIIYDQAGSSPTDSGELWWNSALSSPGVLGIYNSIILPNMTGFSSLEIGSITAGMTNLTAVGEHNTWFGGWNAGAPGTPGGFPAVQVGEGGNGNPGIVGSFRSNIVWNPERTTDATGAAHNYQAYFYKLYDVGFNPSPTTDYCAPANCDYNTGFNHTLTDPAHTQYTNQGRGYAAKFSSTPGVNDVDTDPMFVDYMRSVELFDSKYLNNHPATWNSGSTYSVGQFVSWARTDVYWKLPVNYRYINSGACAGTNPEPGNGTNWRDCWEWASLYRIRQALAAGTTYDDPAIGASASDVIVTLLQWIRAGYAPQNNLLSGAAHDGTDIGAVPVNFTVLSPAPPVYSTFRGFKSGSGKVVVR